MDELPRDRAGRLLPTGECWCGCGMKVSFRNFFAPGHDKRAESAVINIEYGGVAAFLVNHGFGPGGRNAQKEMDVWRREGGTTR